LLVLRVLMCYYWISMFCGALFYGLKTITIFGGKKNENEIKDKIVEVFEKRIRDSLNRLKKGELVWMK